MDIIFFAAISIFIFLKLRAELGKISDEEKTKIVDKAKTNREKIAAIQNQIINATSKVIEETIEQRNQADTKALGNISDSLKQTLNQIFQRCNIDSTFFIEGVKSCFEMTIKAFAQKDLETLKFLLSEKIYSGFEAAISQREVEEKTLNSNLISFEKLEVIDVKIVDNKALVTIKIISKQINYFTDKNEQIIEGRKDEINEMTDIWTFKKDLNSTNPNWIVSLTS